MNDTRQLEALLGSMERRVGVTGADDIHEVALRAMDVKRAIAALRAAEPVAEEPDAATSKDHGIAQLEHTPAEAGGGEVTTRKKRPKKDVYDLMDELLEAIEEIQTWWNATEEREKFDRKVAKIRKQYEKL